MSTISTTQHKILDYEKFNKNWDDIFGVKDESSVEEKSEIKVAKKLPQSMREPEIDNRTVVYNTGNGIISKTPIIKDRNTGELL